MHDLDLMLSTAVPPAVADAAVDRAGLRRAPSRLARVHHTDVGTVLTYIVPVTLPDGASLAIEAAGLVVAVEMVDDHVSLVVRPRSAGGHLLSALASWLTDREDGAYGALQVPLTPGASRYVDLPVVGRCGVRVPR